MVGPPFAVEALRLLPTVLSSATTLNTKDRHSYKMLKRFNLILNLVLAL